MRLAERIAIDPRAEWDRLTPEAQASIGVQAILTNLHFAVHEDDESSAQERRDAEQASSDAIDAMNEAVEAALPGVRWYD